jgi:hypothetical protein
MKYIIAAILLAMTALAVVGASRATGAYTVAMNTPNVNTDKGIMTVLEDHSIGGTYLVYVSLKDATQIQTKESGMVTFPPGTEIDCERAPGKPDPCP